MHTRPLLLGGVTAAAVGACLLAPTAAQAATRPGAPTPGSSTAHRTAAPAHVTAAKKVPGTCYQAGTATGYYVLSQSFTDTANDYSAYDSTAADDVTLASPCVLTEVDAAGQYFNGPGPVTSETVTIWRNNPKLDQPNGAQRQVLSTQTVVGTDDGTGSLTIPIAPVRLKAGVLYWVSVTANMAFDTGGEWGVELTEPVSGHEALWMNAGDGYGDGTGWQSAAAILGQPAGDLALTLKGKVPPTTPTD